MFAPTIEALPRVGEGILRDLTAKTGREAFATSRATAVQVAMARKGKAFGLAGVILVDRNLAICKYSFSEEGCDRWNYLC